MDELRSELSGELGHDGVFEVRMYEKFTDEDDTNLKRLLYLGDFSTKYDITASSLLRASQGGIIRHV